MTARELILWILDNIESFDDVLPISIERRADDQRASKTESRPARKTL